MSYEYFSSIYSAKAKKGNSFLDCFCIILLRRVMVNNQNYLAVIQVLVCISVNKEFCQGNNVKVQHVWSLGGQVVQHMHPCG